MTDDDPPSDLQKLIDTLGRRAAARLGEEYDPKNPAHAGYPQITAQQWAEHDAAMAAWHGRRRLYLGATATEQSTSPPSGVGLCICGRPGVLSRLRTGGGPEIWRCETHRNQWPDYADEIPLKQAAE